MASDRRETLVLLAGDAVLLLCSLWLALALRNLAFPSLRYYSEHLAIFTPVAIASLLIFFVAGLYERQTRLVKRVMGARIFGAQVANTILAALLFFFLPLPLAPKTILALYLLISVIIISAWRFFAAPLVSAGRRVPALLIGAGAAVEQTFDEVNRHRKYYVRFVAHVDTADASDSLRDQVALHMEQGIRLIVLDPRDDRVRKELPELYDFMLSGVSFSEFGAFYESIFDQVPLAHIDHAWLLECLPKSHVGYDIAKAAADRLGAFLGLVVALPMIGAAAALLAFRGGSPFIFHERVGKGGVPFRIIKLRTMLFNDHGDPELQKKNRVTMLGKILRKTRIDELPQLINILRGELSFIGPRPELPSIAKTYQKEIPYYEARHLITPGLSGWAQIWDYDAPRGGADVERTRRKLSYDLYYLKHRSLGLDVVIALKTLRALVALSGV